MTDEITVIEITFADLMAARGLTSVALKDVPKPPRVIPGGMVEDARNRWRFRDDGVVRVWVRYSHGKPWRFYAEEGPGAISTGTVN